MIRFANSPRLLQLVYRGSPCRWQLDIAKYLGGRKARCAHRRWR